jgi:ATP-dependent DNA ligase
MTRQKQIHDAILERLNQYYEPPVGSQKTKKPDLHREGMDWWESHTEAIQDHCHTAGAFEALRSRGITHIVRYQNSWDDSKATEWYNQYVDAAGRVIDEEMC